MQSVPPRFRSQSGQRQQRPHRSGRPAPGRGSGDRAPRGQGHAGPRRSDRRQLAAVSWATTATSPRSSTARRPESSRPTASRAGAASSSIGCARRSGSRVASASISARPRRRSRPTGPRAASPTDSVAACSSAWAVTSPLPVRHRKAGWPILVTDDHAAGLDAAGQTISITSGGVATSSVDGPALAPGRRGPPPPDRPGSPACRSRARCGRSASPRPAASTRTSPAPRRSCSGTKPRRWLRARHLPSRLTRHDGQVILVGDWPEARPDDDPRGRRRVDALVPLAGYRHRRVHLADGDRRARNRHVTPLAEPQRSALRDRVRASQRDRPRAGAHRDPHHDRRASTASLRSAGSPR